MSGLKNYQIIYSKKCTNPYHVKKTGNQNIILKIKPYISI